MTGTDKEKNETGRWPEETNALKSPFVWGIGALFLLFVTVEIYMVTIAISVKPDLVTKDYYERGQSFTERSKQKREGEKALGWKLDLSFDEIKKDKPALFTLSITSTKGAEEADEALVFAYRPSNAKKDFQKVMIATAKGSYEAKLTFGEAGYWDIIAVAQKNGREIDLAVRIFIKND